MYTRLEMFGIILSRFLFPREWKRMMEHERQQVLDCIEDNWKKVYAR